MRSQNFYCDTMSFLFVLLRQLLSVKREAEINEVLCIFLQLTKFENSFHKLSQENIVVQIQLLTIFTD